MRKIFVIAALAISGIAFGQAQEGESINDWLARIHEEAEGPVEYKRGDQFVNVYGEIITLKKKLILLDGTVMWKIRKTNEGGGKSTLYYLETVIEKLQPLKESVIYKYTDNE